MNQQIARELRLLREQNDVSQSEMAKRLGCDVSTISRFENAETDVSFDRVNRYLDELGCRLDLTIKPNREQPIQLLSDQHETIVQTVQKHYGPVPVYLFGSRAHPDRDGTNSDFDLMVDLSDCSESVDELRSRRAELRYDLETKLKAENRVDLLYRYFDSPRNAVIKRVLKNGRRLDKDRLAVKPDNNSLNGAPGP